MSSFAEIALAITRGLIAEAIWHEGRCTWVGSVPELRSGRITMTERSLPPDLYGGTAGIGLVLAETSAVTGDAGCAATALAAIRQSLARADGIEPSLALGLFTGRPGIAIAAIRAGLLLREPELVERGHAMTRRIAPTEASWESYDLIAGRAGAILALLAVAAAMADGALVERADRLGRDVLEAVRRHGGWSWPPADAGDGLDATGLAHGASGAASALVELWAATGHEPFRTAADAGFAAEQRYFDPRVGNWLEDPAGGGEDRRAVASQAMMSWCHGAPGIGMARHLAWRRTGDAGRRSETVQALRVTARWTRAAMESVRGGFSLCHGLAGNAEMLRDCAGACPSGGHDLARLYDEICLWGASEFDGWRRPWPEGGSPSLMTGGAGIARFYLRAHEPRLPSVLLPSPDGLLSELC